MVLLAQAEDWGVIEVCLNPNQNVSPLLWSPPLPGQSLSELLGWDRESDSFPLMGPAAYELWVEG